MEYTWLVYLSNHYISMISPDVSDVKESLIKDIIEKERKTKDVATILRVSTRTIQKWVCRYKYNGMQGLIRSKPWPKSWIAYNRTQEETEEIVSFLWMKYKKEWPERLRMRLDEKYWIHMNQTTVYRILKRRNVRYYNAYQKEKKQRKMYVLEIPWMEMQVDTRYPFGRHRQFVIYSAIDDCTRIAYSKAYENANTENTKDFIKELIRRMPFQIRSIRTDQWREFSKTITKYLSELYIEHIKNEAYHPEHNWKIERYHFTENMWEVINRPYLISIEEANYMLRNWLSYYNYSRSHTGLWMKKLSPWAKYLETRYKMRT